MPADPQPDTRQSPLFDGRSWTQVRWAVVDVEGNGQQPDPDLVEVAVVHVVGGQIGPARSWLVHPPRPVTWQARRVHHLGTADLDDAPTAAQVAPEVRASLAGAQVVVGHQVRVDLAVLGRCLPGWPTLPVVDTLRLARTLCPGLPSYRLGALAEHFQLTTDLPGPAHRAGYDATVTARLLVHLATTLAPGTARQLADAGAPPGGTGGTPASPAGGAVNAGRGARLVDGAATLFEVP